MECPICGRLLSLLEEVLAATRSGAQCRHCWTLLRRLRPASRLARVTAFKPARRSHQRQEHHQRRAA